MTAGNNRERDLARVRATYGSDEDFSYLPSGFFDVVATLPARIRANSASYFSLPPNAISDILPLPAAHSTYPLFRYQLVGADTPREIYVKFAPIYPDKNEGRVEFENLRRISEAFPEHDGYGSPRALDFFDDINAILTEGVGGESFHRSILAVGSTVNRSRRESMAVAARRLGHWLRDYHTAWGIIPCAADPALASVLRCSSEIAKQWPRDLQLNALAARMASMKSGELPSSRLHGDLALDNVLVSPERVSVLDVSYNITGPVVADIAHVRAAILTINNLPRYPFFDIGFTEILDAAFLDGYGDIELAGGELACCAFTAAAVIQRLETQGKTLDASLGRATGAVVRSYVARRYHRIMLRLAAAEG